MVSTGSKSEGALIRRYNLLRIDMKKNYGKMLIEKGSVDKNIKNRNIINRSKSKHLMTNCIINPPDLVGV